MKTYKVGDEVISGVPGTAEYDEGTVIEVSNRTKEMRIHWRRGEAIYWEKFNDKDIKFR